MENKIEKPKMRYKISKKLIIFGTVFAVMSVLMCPTAFAATGAVDSTDFIKTACTVLKSVIILIGAGLGLWGIVNLLEGYSGDNSAAKSQGIKQLMAGLGLILLAVILVPVLQTMMTNAV